MDNHSGQNQVSNFYKGFSFKCTNLHEGSLTQSINWFLFLAMMLNWLSSSSIYFTTTYNFCPTRFMAPKHKSSHMYRAIVEKPMLYVQLIWTTAALDHDAFHPRTFTRHAGPFSPGNGKLRSIDVVQFDRFCCPAGGSFSRRLASPHPSEVLQPSDISEGNSINTFYLSAF